jgi:hypothetical protein
MPKDCIFADDFELVYEYHEKDSLLESKVEERKADWDGYDNERINHYRPPEVMDYQLLILKKLFQLFLFLLFQYFTTHN